MIARFLAVATAVTAAAIVAGCGADLDRSPDGAAGSTSGFSSASRRAVSVSTTACGHAPPAAGSGIAISQRQVLTAAHVVAGATVVTVARSDDPDRSATAAVVAYDPLRDLALLEVNLDGWSVPDRPPQFASLAEGDSGMVVGATGSGATGQADIAFTVAEKTAIVMDEVRGTRRSTRSGYRLDAVTVPGDSGSGLYDREWRLAGLLFAVSTDDGGRSWATAADEVEAFLAGSVVDRFGCNRGRSRLERLGSS